MNQCPVCSSEIQDAFGLVECPSCHKILFADFDGTLKVHDEVSGDVSGEVPVHELTEETSDEDFNTNWNLVPERRPPPLDVLDPVVEVSEDIDSPAEEFAEPQESLNAIEEINRFASSPASSLKEGNLMYNLTIKNIDTEELKEEILAVLQENKLGIDVKNLKFSLPTLVLKNLNPVKVSVIVSKIKHLSVDLEWTQKSVIENEGGL